MQSLKRGGVQRAGAVIAGLSLVALTLATGANPASAASVPKGLSVKSFNTSFKVMGQLKGLVKAGKGLVGVVLPDTTSSVRYVDFDAPYLTRAFAAAGYSTSQFKIDNAQGIDPVELGDVEADIALGAKVIIFDPLDSTVGAEAQAYAQAHGVAFISYDRATFVGKKTYYVSFNNFKVGQLIGRGFMACASAWGVKNPKIFELDGGENSDPNAVSFAQGYNSIIWGKATTPMNLGTTNSSGASLVGDQITPTWTNAKGETIFSQQVLGAPADQRDGGGQRRPRQRGGDGPEGRRRGAEEDPDHGPGRNGSGDGEHPHRLPVRVGLQADLPRGPGCGRAGDDPAGAQVASQGSLERDHLAAERRRRP
jgi:hypothetical protein